MASYGTKTPISNLNYSNGYTTTATAAGTTTLTNASTYLQFFTGTMTQTLKLPDVTTLAVGQEYLVVNYSTMDITVEINSSATAVATVTQNRQIAFTCISTGSDVLASWSAIGAPPASLSGDVNGPFANNLVQFVDGLPIIASNPLTSSLSIYFGYDSTVPTGQQSVGLGYRALRVNTATGSTAAGVQALEANTSAVGNTGIGYQALQNVTTSGGCTAVGYQALKNNTTGQSTAIGCRALQNNTTGNNTAMGIDALRDNVTGTDNVAVGYWSSQHSFVTENNVGVGNYTLSCNNSNNNTAVGYMAQQGTAVTDGTIQQTGTTITGTGTAFVPELVGGTIYNTSGGGPFSQIITAYNSATSLTVATSNTISAGSTFYAFFPTANNTCVGSFANSVGRSSNETCVGYFTQVQTYSVGTLSSVSYSTTVGGVGTAWTSALVGGILEIYEPVFGTGDYSRGRIIRVNSGTQLIVDFPIFCGSGTPYRIYLPSTRSYASGTAGTGGAPSTTVTGVGTTWRPAWDLTNAHILFGNGSTATVSAIASATSMTVTPAVTVPNGTSYTLYLPAMGNTLIGYRSGEDITTGFNNTIIGPYNNTSNTINSTGDGYLVVADGNGVAKIAMGPDVSQMFGQPTTVNTGTYSQLLTDSTLVCTVTTTLTLLAPASYPGRILYIRRGAGVTVTSASSNVTLLNGTSGQTNIIGGAGAANWVMLQSDGSNWITMMGA